MNSPKTKSKVDDPILKSVNVYHVRGRHDKNLRGRGVEKKRIRGIIETI